MGAPLAASPAYGTGSCNRTLVTGCVPGLGLRLAPSGVEGVERNNSNAQQLWKRSGTTAPNATPKAPAAAAPWHVEKSE
eukprot:172853-Prymnesium_polylepis.1